MKNLIFPLLILFTLISCERILKKGNNSGSKKKTEVSSDHIQIRKKYNDEGSVITEVPYRGNIKHGIAKHFYPNGKVSMEIPYVNNLKHGTSYYYYTDGNIYRTTPYVKGRINGFRKKYYRNGKLMAEIPYRNNEPVTGLKEYTKEGELLTQYPVLVFNKINKIESENKVFLQAYFSDGSKNVEFYKKNINERNDTVRIPLVVKNGKVEMEYYVPKGKYLKERIEIVGIKETRRRNPYVDEKIYYLKVRN